VPGLGQLTVVNGTMLYWQFYTQTDLAAAMQAMVPPVVTDAAYITART
jgi:hypothetical protein